VFRQPRFAEALENRRKLPRMGRVVAHRGPVDPRAGHRERRIERKAGIDRGTRLIETAKPRKRGRQVVMSLGIVPVGFDRPAAPQDRLFAIAQVIFRDPRLGQHT